MESAQKREERILAKVRALAERLPKFPDGRVDYREAREAAAINVFIRHGGELLLLKRSDAVRRYRGRWAPVAGYCDEERPVYEKALEEVREELGLGEEAIERFHLGEPWTFFDENKELEWYIVPVVFDVSVKPDIALDREHAQYRWVAPAELAGYDTIPHLSETYRRAVQ